MHEDLDVWKLSKAMAISVYRLVQQMPKQNQYHLGNQLVRASISIPSNIAEGSARGSRTEFAHYISIALGSVAELRTQLEIAAELDLMPAAKSKELHETAGRIGRMLVNLRKSLKSKKN
jgi:four helix bundle protein